MFEVQAWFPYSLVSPGKGHLLGSPAEESAGQCNPCLRRDPVEWGLGTGYGEFSPPLLLPDRKQNAWSLFTSRSLFSSLPGPPLPHLVDSTSPASSRLVSAHSSECHCWPVLAPAQVNSECYTLTALANLYRAQPASQLRSCSLLLWT